MKRILLLLCIMISLTFAACKTIDIQPTTTTKAYPTILHPTARPTTAAITTQKPTTVTITPTTVAPTTTTFSIGEGMYKVGSDIPAGEYIIFATSSSGYFELASNSSGLLESIICNDSFTGNRYITISNGQYLKLHYAKMLPLDKAPVLTEYTSGMYKVGRDIPAGEYKVIPDKSGTSCYLEVAKDSLNVLASIITNDNFTSEMYITISNGQYLVLVNCHIIK